MSAIPETLAELRVPTDSLTTYPRNPRRGSTRAIRESLEQHGQYRPLVVNERTREVLAGNHTYLAARELGWNDIAVTFVNVDDDEAARIVLVDNRTADLAVYDDADLVELLQSFDTLDGTGWDDSDLADLLQSLGTNGDGVVDDDDESATQQRYSFDVYSMDELIERAVEHYRASGFPYRSLPLHRCMVEVNALAAMSSDKLLNTTLGYATADTFHPHRWHAHVGEKLNAIDVFNDDALIRVALKHLIEYGSPLSDQTFVSVCSLTRFAQAVSNFRPAFALMMMRRYAPDDAVVLDTSTGYGGRLVGFLASQCSTYVGVDPARETYQANERLADALCPASKRVELHCLPAEDVPHKLVKGRCDFALTSPPYFAKERYSDEPTQSWQRYSEPELWRESFLVPMLALQHAALRPGGVSLLNVADVDVAGAHVPLVEWTLEAARRAGFVIEGVERYPLQRRWGPQDDVVASEPVIVLRK